MSVYLMHGTPKIVKGIFLLDTFFLVSIMWVLRMASGDCVISINPCRPPETAIATAMFHEEIDMFSWSTALAEVITRCWSFFLRWLEWGMGYTGYCFGRLWSIMKPSIGEFGDDNHKLGLLFLTNQSRRIASTGFHPKMGTSDEVNIRELTRKNAKKWCYRFDFWM